MNKERTFFTANIKYNRFIYNNEVIPMLDSEIIQSVYENKKGVNISLLEDNFNGRKLLL